MAEHPPGLDAALVQEMVGVSHGNLERVRELLVGEPNLARACWDWGHGDFETALQAAAHTGSRAIAELLLAHGAPIDVFAAAMLGRLELVQAFAADDPGVIRSLGAHKIPLLVHALQGGEPAAGVVAWLREMGVE